MRRMAFVLLWLFVFAIPWENSVAFPGLGTASRLIGMLAAGFVLLAVLYTGRIRRPNTFVILALLFVLWSGASLFWSISPESSGKRLQTYLLLLVMVWLVWEVADTESQQHSLLQAYVLGATVSAANTLLNYFGGTTVATGRYAASGFNPNDLGFTLVLALPIAWYMALIGSSRLQRWFNLGYLPLGVLAILLTASRGSAIPGAIAMLLIPWTLPNVKWKTRVASGVLLIAGLYVAIGHVPQTSWDRLSTTAEKIEEGDFSNRGVIWAAGWEVFQLHPIIGVGAGAFDNAVEPILGVAKSAHQTFLNVLVGQGMVGFSLFLAAFATVLWPIRRMRPLQRKFWLVLMCTLVVGLMPRTWDYRKHTWLILGLLASQSAVVCQIRQPREPVPSFELRRVPVHAS
jgi:O-antigen ligase